MQFRWRNWKYGLWTFRYVLCCLFEVKSMITHLLWNLLSCFGIFVIINTICVTEIMESVVLVKDQHVNCLVWIILSFWKKFNYGLDGLNYAIFRRNLKYVLLGLNDVFFSWGNSIIAYLLWSLFSFSWIFEIIGNICQWDHRECCIN